ncbi:MAG TPA: dihydrolipoamide acetyltransferase family protein [Candidatus Obscuribacterales bacterium]
MAVEFKLPDLGEGIHEAEILAVKVKEGDNVKEDQAIFEVETDKAVVEIPSPVEGVIEKIHVEAGQTVTVGTVMVTFDTGSDERVRPVRPQEAAAEAKGSAPVAQRVATKSDEANNGRAGAPLRHEGMPVPAAPATRRLARELGVDLALVAGSGPGGRVLSEDVRSYAAGKLEGRLATSPVAQQKQAPPQREAQPVESLKDKYGGADGGTAPLEIPGMGAAPIDLPDFSKYGPVERVPLRSIRRKIAQNMTISWTHIPHVTHFDEADITNFEAQRAKHEKSVKEAGGRLTLTVFALKAVASALKKYPQFNASLDEKSGELVFKHYYNIGVAVATERGLIVPVIKDVDRKTIMELSIELAEIADTTRSGKIELDRLQGGTFTITNIGAIGGTSMSPMINYPEAAILGMARGKEKPVVRDGKIEIGLILPLALSFDHRIADGAEAAYFVRHVIERLEDPFTLLLEA